MNNFILSFSGIDGSGKSAQIDSLAYLLKKKSFNYKIIWVRPGYTPIMNFAKNILRRIFKNLPPPGKGKKREDLLLKKNIGFLWIVASLFELIWILGIYARLLKFIGYTVIFDRYIDDAIVDLQIFFSEKKIIIFVFKNILKAICNSADYKFFLKISINESHKRCLYKYDPYPETKDKKKIRYEIYEKTILEKEYIVIDGLLSIQEKNKIISKHIKLH